MKHVICWTLSIFVSTLAFAASTEPHRCSRACGGVRRYDLEIDPGKTFQTIEHFGASDCWTMQKLGGWSDENRERLADLLFDVEKGIGLTSWRVNLGAGLDEGIGLTSWRTAETFEIAPGEYDWTRLANQRRFIKDAKARGIEQFIAFANSPPRRMTRNGHTFCTPEIGTTNLKEGMEPDFATYLADILDHFVNHPDEEERIPFTWISPLNEPNWDWNNSSQECCRASNADIKRVALALDAELKKRELPVNILLTESGSPQSSYAPGLQRRKKSGVLNGDYIDSFCGDKDIAPIMNGVFAGHSYSADGMPRTITICREKLNKKMQEYPDFRYWQTEYCILRGPYPSDGGGQRDMSMKMAINVARVMHCDFTIAQATAWDWWLAVSPHNFKDTLIFTDWREPGDEESILLPKFFYTFGHFSKFLRPGSQRIEVRGDQCVAALMSSAYVLDDTIIIILINAANAPMPVKLNIRGIRANKDTPPLTAYVTTDNLHDNISESKPVQLNRFFHVPGRSIMTLTAKR